MSDFDREWFGMPDRPAGFRLDVNTDIHDGLFVVLVCDRCPRRSGRVGAWAQPVDLAYVVSVATQHTTSKHPGEGT